jgi:Tfp pilus assembly PilM family ATPase
MFDDLLSSLKRVFWKPVLGTRGPSVVGIDFGASALKAVQAFKRGGKAVLETYGAIALGPYGGSDVGKATKLSVEQAVSALSDLFREANISTRECALAIPFSASLVSLLELPAVSEDELRTMVPIEARKYIPVPLAEVTLDWTALPEEEFIEPGTGEAGGEERSTEAAASGTRRVGRMSVLVVAIHNETLAHYREVARIASLNVHFVEVEIFSAIRAVLGQSMGTAMIVDVGARTTKIYLVENGAVRGTHSIGRGSQHVTDALSRTLGVSVADAERIKRGESLTEIEGNRDLAELVPSQMDATFAEIRQVLLQYQQRSGKVISHTIFIGGGALLTGLIDQAREALPSDVALGNPFRKFEAPAFLEPVLAEAGPEFATAAGLALRALAEQ